MKQVFYLCFLACGCLFTQISCSDQGSTQDIAASKQATVDSIVTTENNSSGKGATGIENILTNDARAEKARTSEVPTSAKTTKPYLTKAEIVIDFGGDAVDRGTKFETAVYFKDFNYQIASFEQTDGIGDNTRWTKTMIVRDNTIAKEDLPQTTLYLALVQPHGGDFDHAEGKPLVTYTYSDGFIKSYKYAPFAIGTHNESHRTDQPVKEW